MYISTTILDDGSNDRHEQEVCRLTGRYGARPLCSGRNLLVPAKRLIEDEIFERSSPDLLIRVDDDVVLGPGWLDAVRTVLTPRQLHVASAAIIRHRTLDEADVRDARTAPNVIPSWRHFYRRWGFLRRSAAREAGMSLKEFVATIVGNERGAVGA